MKRFAIMVSLQIIEMHQSWLAWVFILCLYLHLQFLGCQELPPTSGTYGYEQSSGNGTFVGNSTRSYTERITTDDTNRTSAENKEEQVALTEEKLPDYHHDNNSMFNCVNFTSNDSRNFMALKFLCVKYFSDWGGGVADRCSSVEQLCLFKSEFNISDKNLEIIRHMPLKSFYLHNITKAEQLKEPPLSAPGTSLTSTLKEESDAETKKENTSFIAQTSSLIPPSKAAPVNSDHFIDKNHTDITVKHNDKDKSTLIDEETHEEIKENTNTSHHNFTSVAPELGSSTGGAELESDQFAGHRVDTNETEPTTTLPNDKKADGYSDGLEKLNVYKIFQDWSKKHRKKGGREENEVVDETHVVSYGDHEGKAELRGKTKTEESQLAGFQWKDEHYMMNVLVPIGVGISGALLIVSLFYLLRTCTKDASGRNVQRRPSRNMGRMEVQMPQETATTDHVMLLADSSDDEF